MKKDWSLSLVAKIFETVPRSGCVSCSGLGSMYSDTVWAVGPDISRWPQCIFLSLYLIWLSFGVWHWPQPPLWNMTLLGPTGSLFLPWVFSLTVLWRFSSTDHLWDVGVIWIYFHSHIQDYSRELPGNSYLSLSGAPHSTCLLDYPYRLTADIFNSEWRKQNSLAFSSNLFPFPAFLTLVMASPPIELNRVLGST